MYVIRGRNSEGAKSLFYSCSLVRRTRNTYYVVFGLKYYYYHYHHHHLLYAGYLYLYS